MAKGITALLALALLGAAGCDSPGAPPAADDRAAPPVQAESSAPAAVPAKPAPVLDEAALREARAAAVAQRETAERQLAELEAKIDALKSEARELGTEGATPADHAAALAPHFEPAFRDYLAAQVALQTAILAEQDADEALAELASK